MTGQRLGRLAPWLLLGVGVLVAGLLTVERRDGPPLDPDSTGPLGAKALVELAGALGADVRVTTELPDDSIDVAVLLEDFADQRRSEGLREWAGRGGTVVVADPASPLAPDIDESPLSAATLSGASAPRGCDVPALAGAERVLAPDQLTYVVPPGATGCYRQGGAWLVVRDEGAGTVVALGGPVALTNRYLGQADNAVLAAALLAPAEGTRVAYLRPPAPGQGSSSLTDLIPARLKWGLAQLAVAFGVFAAWRARRLGRPVAEPYAVAVPGSELVVAVGNLLQQGRARGRAARLLRDDLRRTLTERLGLQAGAPSAAVADRAGLPEAEVGAVLDGTDPADEAGLLALAGRIERLRTTVLHSGTEGAAKEGL